MAVTNNTSAKPLSFAEAIEVSMGRSDAEKAERRRSMVEDGFSKPSIKEKRRKLVNDGFREPSQKERYRQALAGEAPPKDGKWSVDDDIAAFEDEAYKGGREALNNAKVSDFNDSSDQPYEGVLAKAKAEASAPEDRIKAEKDYATRRQAAIGMEVAAGDAEAANRAQSFASEMDNRNTQMDMSGVEAGAANAADARRKSQSDMQEANMTSYAHLTPAKATPVYDAALIDQLYKTTHGTSFDPKSKRDIQKRSEIEEMLGGMGGELGKTTPNQFALQLYRKYKYL